MNGMDCLPAALAFPAARPAGPRQPPLPTLVIGLGDFGRLALDVLRAAAASRPSLVGVQGLGYGPEGWQPAWPGSPIRLEGAPAPAASLEPAALLAQALAGEFCLRPVQGQPEETPPGGPLDIYLLAHLDEDLARGSWRPLLRALRRAAMQDRISCVFTLLLAAHTSAWVQADAGQAGELLQALFALEEELLAASREAEHPGRLGWCYLLDTRDASGRPLAAIGGRRESSQLRPAAIQAHLAAEWIAQLHAGLRRSPAYRQCSLADLQRQRRSQPARARLSLFNAASLALPLRFLPPIPCPHPGLPLPQDTQGGLHHLALARRLLEEIAARPQDARLLPQVHSLRQRWSVDCGLAAAAVRRWLCGAGADPGCDPPGLPLDPPGLEGLAVSAWAGRLQEWEAWLEGRWEGPDSPAKLAEKQARLLVERAGAELDGRGRRLLQRSPGGAPLAAGLAGSARRFLAVEAQRPLVPRPRRAGGWGRALCSFLAGRLWGGALRSSRLPDAKAARLELERQAARRASAASPWKRLVRLGTRLTVAAWGGLALLLLLSGLVPAALPLLAAVLAGWLASLPLLGMVFLGLAALSWLGAALTSALAELLAGLECQRLAEDLAQAIRLSQRQRWEGVLHRAAQGVYQELQACALALEEAAEAQQAALASAACLLQEQEARLRRAPDSGLLLSERRLDLGHPDHQQPPALPAAEVRQAALRFLEAQAPAEAGAAGGFPPPPLDAGGLAAALVEFAAAELARRRPAPALIEWAAGPHRRQELQAALDSLCARLAPAWPLGRSAAASSLAVTQYAGLPASVSANRPLPPAGDLHAAGVLPAGWPGAETWLSSCPDRLSLAACLHGVELDSLDAVRRLQERAARPDQEAQETSCFVA